MIVGESAASLSVQLDADRAAAALLVEYLMALVAAELRTLYEITRRTARVETLAAAHDESKQNQII